MQQQQQLEWSVAEAVVNHTFFFEATVECQQLKRKTTNALRRCCKRGRKCRDILGCLDIGYAGATAARVHIHLRALAA